MWVGHEILATPLRLVRPVDSPVAAGILKKLLSAKQTQSKNSLGINLLVIATRRIIQVYGVYVRPGISTGIQHNIAIRWRRRARTGRRRATTATPIVIALPQMLQKILPLISDLRGFSPYRSISQIRQRPWDRLRQPEISSHRAHRSAENKATCDEPKRRNCRQVNTENVFALRFRHHLRWTWFRRGFHFPRVPPILYPGEQLTGSGSNTTWRHGIQRYHLLKHLRPFLWWW